MENNLITTNRHGSDCTTEINKIRQEVNSVNSKVDQVMEDCKQLVNKESDLVKKNLSDIEDEFEMTMEQFRDFKKEIKF